MKKLAIIFITLLTLTLTLTFSTFAQGLGTIEPPAGFNIPKTEGDPSGFVAGLVRNAITLLVIVAFVIAVIWMIINGIRFILAQGDEKVVASAWAQIYWTLIGLVVILGSFAIIKIVETFFGIHILDAPFQIPTI